MRSFFVFSLLVLVLFSGEASAKDPPTAIFSATYDASSLADAAGETTTVTIPSAALGDGCVASLSVTVAGMTITCYISAAGTASVRVQNESGGTLDLASCTLRVFLLRKGVS